MIASASSQNSVSYESSSIGTAANFSNRELIKRLSSAELRERNQLARMMCVSFTSDPLLCLFFTLYSLTIHYLKLFVNTFLPNYAEKPSVPDAFRLQHSITLALFTTASFDQRFLA